MNKEQMIDYVRELSFEILELQKTTLGFNQFITKIRHNPTREYITISIPIAITKAMDLKNGEYCKFFIARMNKR